MHFYLKQQSPPSRYNGTCTFTVKMHVLLIPDAWGWCTGTSQGDGMGMEEGGGFRMGNTCVPGQIHFNIWQNQYNIVKFKNKIKFKKTTKKVVIKDKFYLQRC